MGIRHGAYFTVNQIIAPTGIPSEEAFGEATVVFNPGNFALEAAKLHGAQPRPIFTFYLDKGVTAWKSPGTCANVDRDGKDAWSAANNAKADDNTCTTVHLTSATYSDWLRLTNFGFTSADLPSGTIPVGIEFEIKRQGTTPPPLADRENIWDDAIYARKTSGQVGDNQADTSVQWPVQLEYKGYGSSTSLLGTTWALADIAGNPDFGFDISAEMKKVFFSGSYASIDHFRVRVHFQFTGIADTYEVPEEDVANAGSLLWNKAIDFSDLSSSDHTLTLINVDGKYTPGHPSFVFAADPQYYYRRYLKIELGYLAPGSSAIYKQVRYRGVVQDWGPAEFPEFDGQDPPVVEVYTQDLLSCLLEQTILGRPDTEGNPRPLVYGQVMVAADQVADGNPDQPVKTAFFESELIIGDDAFNDIIEDADSAGLPGSVALSTTNPYGGTSCAYIRVPGGQSIAFGLLELPVPSDTVWFQFRMRVNEIPTDNPEVILDPGNCVFMEILDDNGVRRAYMEIRAGYQVRFYLEITTGGWTHHDLDFWLNDYVDAYCCVSVVIHRGDAGDRWAKVFLNNTEILNDPVVFQPAGSPYKTLKVGFATDTTAETWSAYFDSIKIWDTAYRYLYQIPGGGVYQSIDNVFVGGAVVYYDTSGFQKRVSKRYYKRRHWLNKRYGKGGPPDANLITYYPDFGGVNFGLDVSGEVYILATKNAITHPVDVLTALFTEAGLAAHLDTASFAAAKAATPDYVVGCFIEDMSALDAVIEACGKALYNLCLQIPVRLIPYLGAAPASVITLADADIITLDSADLPREIVNQVTVKYGWFEHDDRSRVVARDEISITFLGEKPGEWTLEWGEAVATKSRLMAETIAALLLGRLSKARREINTTGFLDLATLLLGQGVTLNSAALGRPSAVYELMELEVDLQEWRTSQKLLSFAIPE